MLQNTNIDDIGTMRKKIIINEQTNEIWNNLRFLPPNSIHLQIGDLTPVLEEPHLEKLSLLDKSSFISREVSLNTSQCLGFILLENAFLTKPTYFNEVLQILIKIRDNNSSEGLDIFLQFLSIMIDFSAKVKNSEVISKQIQDLCNKIEDFNEGLIMYLNAIISYYRGNFYNLCTNPLHMINFLNNCLDFSINLSSSENISCIYIVKKDEDISKFQSFVKINETNEIFFFIYSLNYWKMHKTDMTKTIKKTEKSLIKQLSLSNDSDFYNSKITKKKTEELKSLKKSKKEISEIIKYTILKLFFFIYLL